MEAFENHAVLGLQIRLLNAFAGSKFFLFFEAIEQATSIGIIVDLQGRGCPPGPPVAHKAAHKGTHARKLPAVAGTWNEQI